MVGKCVWFCGVRRAYHVTDSELVSQLRSTAALDHEVPVPSAEGQHAPRER
jgi:hypothetical protein